ncbi:hypothetical protein M9H77_00794 [Catharanthus roseus]|uniref:Uncharacterized protein n=1 Tax=Catharanthus roseus TaxID=4058 RepID=A0ACC0C3N5_CATRO|nr:hypothetical protein M9H77_00794 [Catharanthus roseus]
MIVLSLNFHVPQHSRLAVGHARSSSSEAVVPKGYLAVSVGKEEEEVIKRFLIPTEYLSHKAFGILLREAEEEFGFQQEGVLKIPCQVSVFEKILQMMQLEQQHNQKKHQQQQVFFFHDNSSLLTLGGLAIAAAAAAGDDHDQQQKADNILGCYSPAADNSYNLTPPSHQPPQPCI